MASAHYTTDEDYRPVASNHISKISYNKVGLDLVITFANGARYRYLGVPFALYQGLMRSPSHGVFFWRNIRQRFPYILLKNSFDDITEAICPELKRLDALDLNEQKLRSKLSRGEIDQENFDNLLNVIEGKRNKLTKKLELDGYYGTEVQTSQTQRQGVKRSLEGVAEITEKDTLILFLKGIIVSTCKGIILLFTLFFGLMLALMR